VDGPYRIYAALLFIGALVVAFNMFTNYQKGTAPLNATGMHYYFSQALLLLLAVVPLILQVCGPLYWFERKSKREMAERFKKIKKEIELFKPHSGSGDMRDKDDQELTRLRAELKTAEKQHLWPKEDKLFARLLPLCFAAIAAPLLIERAEKVPESVKTVISILRWSKSVMWYICKHVYGL
jgi:hypothetical protein